MTLLRKCINLTLLFLLMLVATAAAESYQSIRADYHRLLNSSQLQRQRIQWEKLIRRFEQYEASHPAAADAAKASFLQARTWDGLSRASGAVADVRQAIDHYLQMVERYPDVSLADDALFSAGQLAESRLSDQAAAYRYYRRLVDRYPDGDQRKAAQNRLLLLPEPQPEKLQVASQSSVPNAEICLEKIRYWSGPEYTRIVFDLSAPVETQPHLLTGERPRLYFDLPNTDLAEQLEQSLPIMNGLVKQVRTSRYDAQHTRVVCDLYQEQEYRFISLDDPFRLVLDLPGVPSAPTVEQQAAPSNSAGADDSIADILNKVPRNQPVLHVPQQDRGKGIALIVVDAGHGGRDPGAIGPNGVFEKDITLAMAKVLARTLRDQLGVKVMMTRNDDRYLELRERTAFANRVGADLFISLHANAAKSKQAYGVETYFLNLSKNDQAAEVAARENGTSLEDVSNLEAILFDLMANAKINESSRLAAKVQQSLVAELRPHYSRIKDLGVRQGPFHVLLGATMPSVLVEAAFISNSREEKRLLSSNYQQRVANGIVKAVRNYSATIEQVAKR